MKKKSIAILDKCILATLILFVIFSTISISGTQIALALAVLMWITKMIVQRRWDIRKTKLDIPFVLFFIIALAASFNSIWAAQSFINLKNFLLIPVVYLFANNLRDEKIIFKIIDLFVGTATLVAIYGLIKFIITASKKFLAAQSTSMTWGGMSVVFILITTSLFLFSSERRKRVLYGLALIPQVSGLLFSYVRGSYIGFLVGLTFLGFLKNKKIIPYILVVLVLGLLVIPSPISKRARSIFDLSHPSIQVRLHQWRDSVKIFRDYPILGVGWIDLGELHRSYAPPGADLQADEYTIGHFHNNFVMILIYFGIIGFLSFIWLIVRIIKMEYSVFRSIRSEAPRATAIVGGCLAAFLGFLTNGLFDWLFGDAEVITLIWFTVGVTLAIYIERVEQ